jgi:hypothetical protein
MNSLQNPCIQNSKLWLTIYKLEKTRKQKIVLTPIQRYELCNYINGKPYNRKILKEFIY